ncbi:MAG: hypothetical protein LBI95_02315 [Holosporales bacterium]|nr:hypothetical protein [Holosporales bacterium]
MGALYPKEVWPLPQLQIQQVSSDKKPSNKNEQNLKFIRFKLEYGARLEEIIRQNNNKDPRENMYEYLFFSLPNSASLLKEKVKTPFDKIIKGIQEILKFGVKRYEKDDKTPSMVRRGEKLKNTILKNPNLKSQIGKRLPVILEKEIRFLKLIFKYSSFLFEAHDFGKSIFEIVKKSINLFDINKTNECLQEIKNQFLQVEGRLISEYERIKGEDQVFALLENSCFLSYSPSPSLIPHFLCLFREAETNAHYLVYFLSKFFGALYNPFERIEFFDLSYNLADYVKSCFIQSELMMTLEQRKELFANLVKEKLKKSDVKIFSPISDFSEEDEPNEGQAALSNEAFFPSSDLKKEPFPSYNERQEDFSNEAFPTDVKEEYNETPSPFSGIKKPLEEILFSPPDIKESPFPEDILQNPSSNQNPPSRFASMSKNEFLSYLSNET